MVGVFVGVFDGAFDGVFDGRRVGCNDVVGSDEGVLLGSVDGFVLGSIDGMLLGSNEGLAEGIPVGDCYIIDMLVLDSFDITYILYIIY